jgi:hypothetical protein
MVRDVSDKPDRVTVDRSILMYEVLGEKATGHRYIGRFFPNFADPALDVSDYAHIGLFILTLGDPNKSSFRVVGIFMCNISC